MDVEAPREADSAGAYVESPDYFQRRSKEHMAGVPGAGVVELLGPFFLKWIAAVAFAVCVDLSKEPIKDAFKDVWDWFTSLFPKGEKIPSEMKKQETIAAISSALINAGWNAEKAGVAAERVWAQGKKAGQKLASAA